MLCGRKNGYTVKPRTNTLRPNVMAAPQRASVTPILELTPGDLILEARDKETKDVQITDIAISKKPFERASMVVYINNGEMKILKTRYKIVS